MAEFALSLKEAIDFAKENNVEIAQLEYCEQIIKEHLKQGSVNV
jgi:hypothetical protein